jgi:excisionase family DNA binding protein
MDKLAVNADGACEMLSMSRSFFYEQVSTGRIPKAIKIGRKSLWSVEQLRQWVETETKKNS